MNSSHKFPYHVVVVVLKLFVFRLFRYEFEFCLLLHRFGALRVHGKSVHAFDYLWLWPFKSASTTSTLCVSRKSVGMQYAMQKFSISCGGIANACTNSDTVRTPPRNWQTIQWRQTTCNFVVTHMLSILHATKSYRWNDKHGENRIVDLLCESLRSSCINRPSLPVRKHTNKCNYYWIMFRISTDTIWASVLVSHRCADNVLWKSRNFQFWCN